MSNKFRFSIDRGGTFTDIYAEVPKCEYAPHGYVVMKLLSVDPLKYTDAPREGIRRIIEKVTGKSIPKEKVPTEDIEWIRMGTTVATNALLERKGEKIAFVTTKGFSDILEIGNQARPRIFDLEIKKPQLLYQRVIEIDERVRIISSKNAKYEINSSEETKLFVKGISGEQLEILQPIDDQIVKSQLLSVYNEGIKSLSITLLHSYIYPEHEKKVAAIAKEIGFTQISLSSELSPMIRIVPRAQTSCVDAYLTPLIRNYVDGFMKGFDEGINKVNISFMMSDGGLCPVQQFHGYRSILSGPAGGVVGYSITTYNSISKQPVIGFDMGGTSTDVSRYSGNFTHVYDTEVAGVIIQAPQLDINTVAAGGGSRLFFRDGRFIVGPESSGAHPGPVCYRNSGYLSITDANLILGRLLPNFFPKIFGPNENQELDLDATKIEFVKLTSEINQYLRERNQKEKTIEQVAIGFIEVANETMIRPIRNITEAKGYDARNHILACFGGAGAQHACAIARSLGMTSVFVHRYAGILSAYGLGLADVVSENQEPCALQYLPQNMQTVESIIDRLSLKAIASLSAQGFKNENITLKVYLNLRYDGTDTSIMTLKPEDNNYERDFIATYKLEFGFVLTDRPILIDDVRVRAIGKGSRVKLQKIERQKVELIPETFSDCYFEGIGRNKTPVYLLSKLGANNEMEGPAIIIDNSSTILIEPECRAMITEYGDVHIKIGTQSPKKLGKELDPIQLSVFSHRFMSIAEQMGKTLQRTAISTNIKERLDFSCAIFGPDASLVSNAPHIPVHLGAMQDAVSWQIKHLGNSWKEGEVLISNHPSSGGSHLPDITVITPVFDNGVPVFYVASRGHHADIGGISPGSMPPFSRSLVEEGVCIDSFKLVVDGNFREKELKDLLMSPTLVPRKPFEAPLSGTRNLHDNISDLKAQVAANQKGINLVKELIEYYSLEVVQAYMLHVQNNAEQAVRDMFKQISKEHNLNPLNHLLSEDFMDDGSKISLQLTIDRTNGSAIFDFSGTDPEVYGNINAPVSVTKSAIIYCLRCLVNRDIPLNNGCLKPIQIKIPEGSILCPSDVAAVVGGNVLTSQRVTDIILSAFGACANSQGCMNNFTFGDETMGYYETIAGGAGAGPTWNGADAVQVHMTNTRITDPEILERRYPVLLRQFSVRRNSGGKGKHKGGDGVIREIEFLKDDFSAGILSERRAFAPKGIKGGQDAERGKNLLIKKDGRIINLGPKNFIQVNKGDRIRILTPGGGGFGNP